MPRSVSAGSDPVLEMDLLHLPVWPGGLADMALWGPKHQTLSVVTSLRGCGSARWSGEEAWLPAGQLPGRGVICCRQSRFQAPYQLVCARLRQMEAGTAEPSHGRRWGRGLARRPHGESEKAELGPLHLLSSDPQVTSWDAQF